MSEAMSPGWINVSLGECVTLVAGVGFPKHLQGQTGQEVPVYKVGDISRLVTGGGRFLRESPNTLSMQEALNLASRLVPKDATAFAKIGAAIALNRRAVTTRLCFFDNNVFAAIPAEDCLHPILLYYFLRCVKLDEYSRATTVPSLRKSDVEDIEFPLAPIREQHRIVEALDSYLSRLDAAEEGLKRVEANLKRYRASVLKAAVEGRLVPTEAELARQEGRDYEPAPVLLERILKERRRRWEEAELAKMAAKGKVPKNDRWKAKYKEPVAPDASELPELPEGWCWASLDQLAWDSSYGTSIRCSPEADGLPVLRIPNVSDSRLRLSDMKFATRDLGLLPGQDLNEGDFLIIRTNGSRSLIGRAAFVDKSLQGSHFFASYLIRFRLAIPDSMTHIGCWLSYFWQAPDTRIKLEAMAATSAGQYNLSMTSMSPLAIPLPPFPELVRVCGKLDDLLSVVEATAAAVNQDADRTTSLRQSILKWAFEGKLVDQDPNDEPASKLLDRIRAERAVIGKGKGRKRGQQMKPKLG